MKGALSAWIRKSSDLLSRYEGEVPFHHYLKRSFTHDRRMGSRDRRMIRAFCYARLRCRGAIEGGSEEDNALAALFLTQPEIFAAIRASADSFLSGLPVDLTGLSIRQRADFLSVSGVRWNESALFTDAIGLSEGLDLSELRIHQLQPLPVWLRVRKGMLNKVRERLEASGVPFTLSGFRAEAMAVSPQTDIASTGIVEEGLAGIQDIGSQLTLSYSGINWQGRWLDAFAGAGGKSLLLLDEHPGISLSVSDIRPSALLNLRDRFRRNGYNTEKLIEADYTTETDYFSTNHFDGIIADVPCSGSGTWARTPEDRLRFQSDMLRHYCERQRTVSKHLLKYLRPGGIFIYITCSVFRNENEDVVTSLRDEFDLELVESKVLNGAQLSGDYLYTALLKKKGA